MILKVIEQFNWIDLLFIIILLKLCLTALKTGLIAEIFKLLGTITSTYLSFHYYTLLSDLVSSRFSTQKMPLEFLDFLSFVVLSILGYLIFVSIRSFISQLIKMEALPNLNKIGGLIFGLARAVLVVSLVSFILNISSISYLKTSIRNSYLARQSIKAAPATYIWLWNSIASKFLIGANINKASDEALDNFYKQ